MISELIIKYVPELYNAAFALPEIIAHAAPFVKVVSAALKTLSIASGSGMEALDSIFDSLNLPEIVLHHFDLAHSFNEIAGKVIHGNLGNIGDLGAFPQEEFEPCGPGDIYISEAGTNTEHVLKAVCNAYEDQLEACQGIEERQALDALLKQEDGLNKLGMLPPNEGNVYDIDTCIQGEPILNYLNTDKTPLVLHNEFTTAYPSGNITDVNLTPEQSAQLFTETMPENMTPLSPEKQGSPICGGLLIPLGGVLLGAVKFDILSKAKSIFNRVIGK